MKRFYINKSKKNRLILIQGFKGLLKLLTVQLTYTDTQKQESSL